MDRLTKRFKDGEIYSDEFGAVHKIKITYENGEEESVYEGKLVDKLAEYEDLEESGRIVKLPCALGDTVYVPGNNNDAVEFVVSGFTYEDGEWLVALEDGSPFTAYVEFDDVFLTSEDAETKLKEMEVEK